MNLVPTLQAEWLKFRSVRSTPYTLAITVLLSIGLSALGAWAERTHWPRASLQEHLAFDPVGVSLLGFFFAPLAVGVVGVLVMSSEYSSGSIRSTLAAQPRRISVLLSKAIVLFGVTFALGEACSFCSFLIGQWILRGVTPTASLSSMEVLRAVVLAGLSLGLLALLALGIATILRHTAGSIAVYVSLLLVVLIIVTALPLNWSSRLLKYLPEILIATMRSTTSAGTSAQLFSPWVSTLVLGAYALAALILGGVLLSRRDA